MAFGLPVELARLDLTLEGKQYELFFADDVSEKRLGLRHVTMSVMNDVESHARFSINASGEVYGTLKTPDATYVFEPSDVAGEQLVYRYGSFDKSSASRGIERSLIGKSALARRHHQLDALADIRPITARTDENRAFIRGGELGSILRSSPQEFKRIAAHLSAITNLRGNEQFEVVAETSTFDGGKIVSFRQTLDGIQVDAHNEIVVDGHGKVLELSTHVVPTDIARQKALISLDDAIRRTTTEVSALLGKTISKIDPITLPQLRYIPEAENSLALAYVFQFEVADEGHWYLARVDAGSGRTELTSLLARSSYVSCKDTERWVHVGPKRDDYALAPPATDCLGTITPKGPRTIKGYANPARSGFCTTPSTPNQPSNCALTDTKNPYEVMSEIEAYFPGAIATNPAGSTPACCNQIDITIIQNSTANISSSDAGAYRVRMIPSESSSAEILAHEIAHIYSQIYNNGTLVVDQNVFARAVKEGAADTVAGIIGAMSGRTSRYGTQWVYGDGPYFSSPDGTTRSASNPNFNYWQDITLAAGGHKSGQVIYRFFRRLQEISGINNQRLLGIVLGTLARITDERQPQGIDVGDFLSAVKKAIHPNETALLQAVDTLHRELYKAEAAGPLGPPLPPGDPGPIGAPPITPNVWGSFAQCGTLNGATVSIYQTYWTATTNTTRYIGWAKADSEPAFRYSIDVPSSVTQALLVTSVPGEGRISSCNASGCSGLSLSRVVVTQLCGF